MINKKTFLNYFSLILWMGFIYFLSSQPDLKSGLESWLDFVLRKAAHITEYAILTFLAWRVFADGEETEFPFGNLVSRVFGKRVLGNRVSKWPRALMGAIIFAFIFSATDEYHQTFVVGRVGSPVDVLIDSVGIGIMGIGIWRKRQK